MPARSVKTGKKQDGGASNGRNGGKSIAKAEAEADKGMVDDRGVGEREEGGEEVQDDKQKEVERQDEAEKQVAEGEEKGKGKVGKEEAKEQAKDGEKMKGTPGKKRDRSPEGGGVAGRDAKKSKNAYEISELVLSF